MKALRSITLGLCAVGLFLAGCAPEAPESKRSSSATRPEGPVFHKLSFEQALSKAKTEGKLVMVDFYADWCGPCRHLDETTWKDPDVEHWLADKAVAIKIDIDKEGKLAEKYKIESIPALVFFKPDGSEVERVVGYRDPKQFLGLAGKLPAGK